MNTKEGASEKDTIREKIIGLGESSARKSYYPQLLEHIRELRDERAKLMDTVRLLEEREEELERLVDEKSALLSEVHHRVKNNFQIIGSLLSLGSGASAVPDEAMVFGKTRRRIDTMAQVYEQLLQSGDFSGVDFCELLRHIAGDIQSLAGLPGVKLHYEMSCRSFPISIDLAIPLALIANEAISNAFTYAFADGKGELTIRFEREKTENGFFCSLEIRDSGPGFPQEGAPEGRKTLGMILIDVLVNQIGGSWKYESPAENGNGTSFKVLIET